MDLFSAESSPFIDFASFEVALSSFERDMSVFERSTYFGFSSISIVSLGTSPKDSSFFIAIFFDCHLISK